MALESILKALVNQGFTILKCLVLGGLVYIAMFFSSLFAAGLTAFKAS